MRSDLPTGIVTFLFSDIEGSTRLLSELGSDYEEALERHRDLMREAVARNNGVEVDTQGDAFFCAFARADDAVAAAAEAQRRLAGGRVRVRIGVHTGEASRGREGYVGIDVHRAARICSAAHGSQVVLSERTHLLTESDLELRDLGLHRLKDLVEPVRLFQLGAEGFPPLRSLNATNLPVASSPLIGRERELAELMSLALEHRLITLTGPGGTGKTRLALHAAAELIEAFPDGVFWVPLAAFHDPELLLPTVEQALGAKTPLQEHVDEKRMLLLLDNFERLVEAAPLLAGVLDACPRLHVLVTSRVLLRIAGELEYHVPPLPEDDATELFRARAVDAEPAEAVLAICSRLDGLPLAIELAAARTRVLTPEKLLVRLEQRLPLLTSGTRDAPARQRTLRATIDWSHDLLSEVERRLFARLGVFAGGFTLEAAEQVCDADIGTLESLIEQSLVRRDGERFMMLETIREYALERLEEAADPLETKRRHALHFVALAERAYDLIWQTEEVPWRRTLERERGNIREALSLLRATEAGKEALRLVTALGDYWDMSGELVEGRAALEQILEASPDAPAALRARALAQAGRIATVRATSKQRTPTLEASLELWRAEGDAEGTAYALQTLPMLRHGLALWNARRPCWRRQWRSSLTPDYETQARTH